MSQASELWDARTGVATRLPPAREVYLPPMAAEELLPEVEDEVISPKRTEQELPRLSFDGAEPDQDVINVLTGEALPAPWPQPADEAFSSAAVESGLPRPIRAAPGDLGRMKLKEAEWIEHAYRDLGRVAESWRDRVCEVELLRTERDSLEDENRRLGNFKKELMKELAGLKYDTETMSKKLSLQHVELEENEKQLSSQVAELHRTKEILESLRQRATIIMRSAPPTGG